MPAFDSNTRGRIQSALNSRAPNAHCPMCNSTSLALADGLVNLGLASSDMVSMLRGGESLPSVALICNQCGYTLLFNVLALDLPELLQL